VRSVTLGGPVARRPYRHVFTGRPEFRLPEADTVPRTPPEHDLTPHDPLPEPRCPNCQAPLEVHQPDVEHPERLLGTCKVCKAWCLIYPDEGEVVQIPVR
jgi:hypothetical protein